MMQTTIKQIQEWYKSHCNGGWEHSYGIQIDTIDNPGWRIKISTRNSKMEIMTGIRFGLKIKPLKVVVTQISLN